jgi:arylsulfatase A-like enzyme
MVFWFPGRVPGGRRIATPASIEQIPATVLDILGRKDHRLPGRSLLPTWRSGAEPSGPDTLVAYIQKVPNVENLFPAARGDIVSLAAGGFRYIWYPEENREELFDFDRDVWETTNLADTPAGRARLPDFRAAARRIIASRAQWEPRSDSEAEPPVTRQ